MFTNRCFIRKNNKELIKSLKELGYYSYADDDRSFIDSDNGEGLCVWNYDEVFIRDGEWLSIPHPFYSPIKISEIDEEYGIDCGDDEDLFLAIAALRDDSNEHQWFVWDFEEGDEGKGDRWKLYDNDSNWCWWIFEVHKATVEELIDHFKK